MPLWDGEARGIIVSWKGADPGGLVWNQEYEIFSDLLCQNSLIRVESLVVFLRAPRRRFRALQKMCVFVRGRTFWCWISVERVILRTELKTERKNSSISKSYDRNKVSVAFLQGKRLE